MIVVMEYVALGVLIVTSIAGAVQGNIPSALGWGLAAMWCAIAMSRRRWKD